ncbi:MAG: DoxX family protein [Rhizobium sp.]|nr:MAG: DoxX family protein [Rhizobium sp.]
MPFNSRYIDLGARVLMATIFILSGLGKLGAIGPTQTYMAAFGLPPVLVYPTIAFELGSGLMLVLGLYTRPLAIVLAGFSIVTALIFHTNFGDQMQMINFLKNLVMAGGFLLLSKDGAPGFSLKLPVTQANISNI